MNPQNNPPSEILAHLYSLLSHRVVLLPIPKGTKGPKIKDWQKLTLEAVLEPNFQALLNAAGNIGVLLGPPSDNLVDIDLDNDQAVKEFCKLNQDLINRTLQTIGSRGRHFFFRIKGPYPQRVSRLECPGDEHVGEWRGGGGAQTVIAGTHPSGVLYRIVNQAPVLEIEFSEIIWPPEWMVPADEEEQRKNALREKYKYLKSKPLAEASDELPPVLIEDILLQRRRILICGVSFGRKTWLCMQIAFCLSKGLAIFGRFKTEKIPVLYGNLELLEASAKRRFQAITKAIGYQGDHYENLRIISATEFTDIIEDDFADFLALQASDDQVKAVCVDPVWRLLGNREENSNTGIGQVFKPFSKFSREADASAIGVHHYAKGSPAAKEVIDRGSGAGAFARDAATLLMLTAHKEADAYVIDIVTNDFPKTDRFCIRFNHPIFELAPDLDPDELKMPVDAKGPVKKSVEQTEKIFAVLYARDSDGGLAHADICRYSKVPRTSVSRILKQHSTTHGKLFKSIAQINGRQSDIYALSPWFRTQLDQESSDEP